MAENSGIEWTTHTFNPWIGCTRVSAACDNCYAEAWDNRFGGERWGPHAPRTRTKIWGNPIKWNKQAAGAAERPRVFVASLADVFDNHKSIEAVWRRELWSLIRQCQNLDFLLLTKRPQNIGRFLPDDWRDGYSNVWLGATVENQTEADRRIPKLVEIPARVHFLSCEPLQGPVNLRPSMGWLGGNAVNWVIAGGENGPRYRPADPQWFRHLRDQCAAADVPFLFKQWEGRNQREIKAKGRELDGVVHDGYPASLATVQ
jgi:protein gp37